MIRWVASYPKSGSTWLRLYLIACEDPDGFDINHRPPHHLQDTHPDYFGRVSPAPVEELTEAEAFALRGAALVHMIRDHGRPVVKTHAANITLDGQYPMAPLALTERIVFVVRDPRDVAVSLADHEGWPIDETIAFMANDRATLRRRGTLLQILGSWSLHVGSWTRELPVDQFTIRYEDMMAAPGRVFRAATEFLGMDVDKETHRRALALTSFDALADAERRHGFQAKSVHQDRFFREGRAGGWRDVLTPEQAQRIEGVHSKVMEAWGYR